MYIRFVVGSDSDSPRTQSGLFTEAEYLRKNGLLESYQEKLVTDIFKFFNDNLPCPPYSKKKWSIDAISWFKDTACEYIDKMRDLAVILEENNLIVRVLKTDRLGMILYEDEFQIVSQNKIY
jgi:hypothetical protein